MAPPVGMRSRWVRFVFFYRTSYVGSTTRQHSSRIRGVVANYPASQARDPGIDSNQHLKNSWHIWRHLRNDTVFSCNLRYMLIFLHSCSRTYRVASLRAGLPYNQSTGYTKYGLPALGRWAVFRITCTLIVNKCGMSLVISINEYTFF